MKFNCLLVWFRVRFELHCVIMCGRPVLVQDLYVDYESESEPMNFFHVFLYSQALECVVLSTVI
jgi:hypothetical protein